MLRTIAFGDSFTDLGSPKDALARTNSRWSAGLNTPPAIGTSAQNGKNLIEIIEDEFDLLQSVPFKQVASGEGHVPFCA